MIQTGETYDVEIVDVASDGSGKAYVDGFPILVQNADVGNKLKVRVTRVLGKFAVGEKV
jgi:predicted RNA-binding protein with TRAM domain